MIPALVALVALWAVVAGWLLVGVGSSLDAGRDRLEVVRVGATPTSLLDDETDAALGHAGDDFGRARSRLRNPILTPLRALPVAGRQVRALDRVVATSRAVTDLAADGVADLREVTERPLEAGPERVAVLEDLSALAARTGDDLAALDPGSPDALVGPLADGVDDLASELEESRASLTRGARAAESVADLLEGPTPYLLIGANNAEMRAGSGMFLSAAPLDFDAGRLDLGEVRPTETLVLPEGAVPVGGDLDANWPWLDPARDLRNVALSVDFPQVAPVAAANWAQVPGGGEVGGIIVVDVDAVRSLLEVVGPVEVDGITYREDTVRSELLGAQYARFGEEPEERRDQLGEVARAIFDRIDAGEWELDELATSLLDVVARRHLLIWSSDPEVQEAWETTGVDGALDERSVSVGMLNRAAQKLDVSMATEATLDSEPLDDGRLAVDLRYQVANRAPGRGPTYQVGPNIDGLEVGEHRGIVVVNLPAGATDVELNGARQTLLGTDGPTTVVAGEVALLRGEEVEVQVRAVLPEGIDEVTIEASARIPRTQWTVNGRAFETERRRTVDLAG
ncbi:hypothetical protein BH23ACT2_BH23ACT2_31120 [soil metagenome]